MTDMTAEQALDQLKFLASDHPGAFDGTLETDTHRMAEIVSQALSQRVPEGWRDFVREVVESAEGYEGRSGNKVNGDWVSRGRALLTAAPAPADDGDEYADFAVQEGYQLCGDLLDDIIAQAPAPADSDPMPMPLFQTMEGEEINRLRERVKELEDVLHKMIGVPALAGFCEPIEGYVKRPHDAVDVMREMAARLRGGSDE